MMFLEIYVEEIEKNVSEEEFSNINCNKERKSINLLRAKDEEQSKVQKTKRERLLVYKQVLLGKSRFHIQAQVCG